MKKILTITLVSSFIFFFVISLQVAAGDLRAVILAAKAGDAVQSETNAEYCAKTRELLEKSGFDAKNIKTFFDGGNSTLKDSLDIKKKNILNCFNEIAEASKENDELWLFIYGYADMNSKGIFLVTKEGRISAEELSNALDRIPGNQKVFCFNQQSAGFMPLLEKKGRIVVTAANNEGQINPPLLTKYFLDIWEENTSAPLIEILSKAADETDEYYTDNGLALAENAAFFDGETLSNRSTKVM